MSEDLRRAGAAALYYSRFVLRDLFSTPLPIVGGLSITDVCNLDCRHCWRKNTGAGHQPMALIEGVLGDFFRRGVRYLYIQGGEPYTYREDGRTVADVVAFARRLGFFHIAICTNGTYPLKADPDTHWVSLDDAPGAVETIRGGTQALERNIKDARGKAICANVTLNRINSGRLREIAEFVSRTGQLKGFMVNFHIPYRGVEDLTLTPRERVEACREAADLKRSGYPVLNSFSGLRALGTNRWRKPMPYSIVSDCRTTFRCCRANGSSEICAQCGYAVWAELSRWKRLSFWEDIPLLRRLHGWRAARG